MAGRHDPDCRRAFPWREDRWDGELLEFFQSAIRLRRSEAVLRHGDYRTLAAQGDAVAFLRTGEAGSAVIMLNAGTTEQTLTFSAEELDGRLEPVQLAGAPAPRVATSGDGHRVTLPGRSGGVLLGRS
jgi:glycosidase